MKCKRCNENIDMFKPPFGGYFCMKDHAQCASCELSSSLCPKCGKETKYKSPHFASEKDISSKAQIPIVNGIEISEEDELKFGKLRLLFLNGSAADGKNLFKSPDELHFVRTLSAIIKKDLFSANNYETSSLQKKDAQCYLRLQKIMRAIRETGCPATHQPDNLSDEDESSANKNEEEIIKDNDPIELKLLYPQHSQLRASVMKKGSSVSCFSKICFKSDMTEEYKLTDYAAFSKAEENSSLNWANFKTVSCMNLVETPPVGFPISIEADSLDKLPFNCPMANCLGKFFVSDFNQHIIHDHPGLSISQLRFGQFKELFIDIKRCTYSPHGVACFLLYDIVKNFSTPPLKNILPMLLLIGRFRFDEKTKSCHLKGSISPIDEAWTYLDSLVIWFVGIVPEQCEISVGISLFSKYDDSLSRWFINNLNPIQNLVTYEDVFQKARRLVLTFREVQMLTNGFRDNIHCQIGLVNYVLKKNPIVK